MRVVIGRTLPFALAIVFVVGVHGTEVLTAAQAQPGSHNCECAADCTCRGPDRNCSCSRPELTMKARLKVPGTWALMFWIIARITARSLDPATTEYLGAWYVYFNPRRGLGRGSQPDRTQR